MVCAVCKGKGTILCDECGGSGFIMPFLGQQSITHEKCDGTGRIRCPVCRGRK